MQGLAFMAGAVETTVEQIGRGVHIDRFVVEDREPCQTRKAKGNEENDQPRPDQPLRKSIGDEQSPGESASGFAGVHLRPRPWREVDEIGI